jgi:hypothetical protein
VTGGMIGLHPCGAGCSWLRSRRGRGLLGGGGGSGAVGRWGVRKSGDQRGQAEEGNGCNLHGGEHVERL